MYGSYYSILGVSGAASEELIRARYLALIRRYHPDHNASPLAHARAAEINEAFRVLTNRQSRTLHDRELARRRIAALRLPRLVDQNSPRGRAMRRGQRGARPMRDAGRVALFVLLAGTLAAGWQLERRLARPGLIERAPDDAPVGWAGAGDVTGARQAVRALAAATLADESAMPTVLPAIVAQGVRAFARADAHGGLAAARAFSERCHERGEADGRWDTTDFCAAFDHAAYVSAGMESGAAIDGVGYFIDMHDRQRGFYTPRVISAAAIDARLEQVRALVAPPEGDHMKVRTVRVLRSIKRGGRVLAGAARGLFEPKLLDEAPTQHNSAADF